MSPAQLLTRLVSPFPQPASEGMGLTLGGSYLVPSVLPVQGSHPSPRTHPFLFRLVCKSGVCPPRRVSTRSFDLFSSFYCRCIVFASAADLNNQIRGSSISPATMKSPVCF